MKSYVVIGLGRFGTEMALQLYGLGEDVLAIDTDEGISGWGEPVIEGRADTVAAAVKEFEPYVIGKDVFRSLARA